MPLSFNFGEENRPELFAGKPKTPVTLLSGFLGSGKTTLLKHLLENQVGVRIGVVVNDVAAVNIDSQLVRRYEKGLVEVTELQNGCVCCSSADDLFSAVQNVVMRSKDHAFEHIVVELSGVGEPEAVKKNWAIGLECGMPVALRTEVKQVVTVVDASTFGRDWLDTRCAQERNEEVKGEGHDEKNKARLESVGQLLAEQVEWADVVLVNKVDLASEEELQTTLEVVGALNSRAPTPCASFGCVAPEQVLPAVPKALRTLEGGSGEGYSWSQTPADVSVRMAIAQGTRARDVDFAVSRQTLRLGLKGRPKPCLDGRLAGELRDVADALWEIEGDGADRCVAVTLEKRRRGMWPGLWLAQEPATLAEAATTSSPSAPSFCSGYRASHMRESGAERRFGLRTFVFRSRRPFSGQRLGELLAAWPRPGQGTLRLGELQVGAGDDGAGSRQAALRPVLRSKGFCWLDSQPLRQHVWAHAGRSLGVSPGEWWWVVLDEEQLKFKITYPGVEAEYKQARREKWDQHVGDRRQEVVFIGGPDMCQEDIVRWLDACLLDDQELEAFWVATRELRVPNDEFHVNSLLRNLGATEGQIQELDQKEAGAEGPRQEVAKAINQKGDERDTVEKSRRVEERGVEERVPLENQALEETELLRSLGVGGSLREAESGVPRATSGEPGKYELID